MPTEQRDPPDEDHEDYENNNKDQNSQDLLPDEEEKSGMPDLDENYTSSSSQNEPETHETTSHDVELPQLHEWNTIKD